MEGWVVVSCPRYATDSPEEHYARYCLGWCECTAGELVAADDDWLELLRPGDLGQTLHIYVHRTQTSNWDELPREGLPPTRLAGTPRPLTGTESLNLRMAYDDAEVARRFGDAEREAAALAKADRIWNSRE
ncbi:hypothetical protein ACFQH9_02045 [Pseudonocardia lutea]|uniref:Uncharacterized protein n=1 Tax=Pseudonocardia lutea TaxID=2172015 RepID=A0ABW1I2N2_9PSEU